MFSIASESAAIFEWRAFGGITKSPFCFRCIISSFFVVPTVTGALIENEHSRNYNDPNAWQTTIVLVDFHWDTFDKQMQCEFYATTTRLRLAGNWPYFLVVLGHNGHLGGDINDAIACVFVDRSHEGPAGRIYSYAIRGSRFHFPRRICTCYLSVQCSDAWWIQVLVFVTNYWKLAWRCRLDFISPRSALAASYSLKH